MPVAKNRAGSWADEAAIKSAELAVGAAVLAGDLGVEVLAIGCTGVLLAGAGVEMLGGCLVKLMVEVAVAAVLEALAVDVVVAVLDVDLMLVAAVLGIRVGVRVVGIVE